MLEADLAQCTGLGLVFSAFHDKEAVKRAAIASPTGGLVNGGLVLTRVLFWQRCFDSPLVVTIFVDDDDDPSVEMSGLTHGEGPLDAKSGIGPWGY